MRAADPLPPRQRVDAGGHAELEQRVPRRVELDLVDSLAEPVVRAQDGRVCIGEPTPFERLARQLLAELDCAFFGEAAAFAAQRLDERDVVREEVHAFERRRLVGRGARLEERHSRILRPAPGAVQGAV